LAFSEMLRYPQSKAAEDMQSLAGSDPDVRGLVCSLDVLN